MANDRIAELVGGGNGRAPSRQNPRMWLTVRYRLTPWWGRVLAIFIASRVVTTVILLAFASVQKANYFTGAQPNYLNFAKLWDGHWYFIIAVAGYPSVLPLGTNGHVAENAWAFLPAYPSVVRSIMLLTGLDFSLVAVIVSVGFALGTALLFYRLMRLVLPQATALFSVVLLCFAPLSPILQVSYAESMHAFFVTLALYLLVKRQYWMLFPVVAVMALTRPSGIAFALTLALHVIYRWVTRVRDPFVGRQLVAAVSATVFSAFMGFAWVLVAWAFTGNASAYTETELAWRAPYIGYHALLPFVQLVQAAGFWHQFQGGDWLIVGAIVALFGFFATLLSPPGRRLGVDIRFWLLSYLLYLLAVFFPQSSTFRLLVPAFPVLGAIAQPRSRIYRIALVVACIAGQVFWIYIAWWIDGRDWTPP